MSEITFKVNEFKTYEIAREGISFGFIDTSAGGYSPAMGERLQYDGNTVILNDGREFTDAPQLRSAIREGWITQVGSKTVRHTPKSAGIKVSPIESKGFTKASKSALPTEQAEENTIISVQARTESRLASNADAARNVPLHTSSAQKAMASQWATEDNDLNDIIAALDQVSRPVKTAQKKSEEQVVFSVENQDDRLTMPILRDEHSDNSGEVVANIKDRHHSLSVEQEQEFPLNVAQAKPPVQKSVRMGAVGAIVHDEQRDMGAISLSSNRPAIKLDDTAVVKSSGVDMIRMGEKAEIGSHAKKASAPNVDQGVAVGRVLSPTHQSFTANPENTSTTAIQRTAEGRQPKIEKFAVSSEQNEVQPVATGDVQEPIVGEGLEDILPEAATPAAVRKPEVHRRPEDDPAYAAVKLLIPNFEWNKDRPVKERVADALKRYQEPLYVKGILAVETEHTREEIKKGLAKLLKKTKKTAS